jgi:hypothetical protein
MAEKLDHGVVNLPLDKRGGGSLDAQIDRFKAGQQRDAKAAAKDKHARSVEAKEFVDNMDDAQLRRLAEKSGMTVVQARKKLLSMARFEPDKVLRLKAVQPTEETMRSLIRRLEEEAGRSKEIADEILRQLGGRRFLVMTGAKNLLAFDTLDAERKWPGLQVQFPHGNAKVMRIALAPDDTYVIQFMTRAGRITKEMDDIYSEVLQRVVSDYTGLALSL